MFEHEHRRSTPGAIARMHKKLRCRWPLAFCHPPKPLAIGIGPMVACEMFPRDCGPGRYVFQTPHGRTLSDAIGAWTRTEDYLAACTPGAERVDLHGAPVGTVTDEAAAWALKELERLKDDRGPPNLRLV